MLLHKDTLKCPKPKGGWRSLYTVFLLHIFSKILLQKRLFVHPYMDLQDSVEVNLLLHQAIDDVVSDRFPVTSAEAIYLASLRAQVILGGFNEDTNLVDYV